MTYKVGIVGSSFGATVHAPAYTQHPKFEVVALASPRNAAATAAERHIPHAFASLEQLLAKVDVDVVSVASPPFDHYASVLRALAAGKHVLCEKPLALNFAQAQEMTAAAQAAGTACVVAHEFRYAPAEATLKALIDRAEIAAIRQIEVTLFADQLRAAASYPRSAWWFSRARGGGVANSFVPHLVDLANWYARRAPLVTAGFGRTANTVRHDPDGEFTSDVFDGVFALLDYGDGLVARITADATTSMNQATLALHAESISVVANGEGLTDMRLFSIEPHAQSEFELSALPAAKFSSAGVRLPPFIALLDDFALRIENGGGNAPTFADGLETQRVLAALGYTASGTA